MEDEQEERGALLSLRALQLLNFESTPKKTSIAQSCESLAHRLFERTEGLEVVGSAGSGLFPVRALEVPVQAPCGEANYRSPVEGCTRGRDHNPTHGAHQLCYREGVSSCQEEEMTSHFISKM